MLSLCPKKSDVRICKLSCTSYCADYIRCYRRHVAAVCRREVPTVGVQKGMRQRNV